ncbi:hypothetical protein Asppvi_002030 [Aspergillus pseudoviridinutans]|uniref:Uncharacterized protein n=1 Tax=Aspergillus pseudoviridinutans TaxID=1517512 RepID=A0A9P3F0Q8_9EURO|nr:uncharacterized protein Asppvi_002030 [Aspergillus pseudoviridinutans]GIJ92752.1 hypothetical protein Asppvi_002030 [Aspergillus pseudoviridinutans]
MPKRNYQAWTPGEESELQSWVARHLDLKWSERATKIWDDITAQPAQDRRSPGVRAQRGSALASRKLGPAVSQPALLRLLDLARKANAQLCRPRHNRSPRPPLAITVHQHNPASSAVDQLRDGCGRSTLPSNVEMPKMRQEIKADLRQMSQVFHPLVTVLQENGGMAMIRSAQDITGVSGRHLGLQGHFER